MRTLPILLCAALTTTALQAQIAPDAGSTLRDLQRSAPQAPAGPTLELNLPDLPHTQTTDEGPTLTVQRIQLEGNQAVPDARLLPLLADLLARPVTLAELQLGAHRITRLYRELGYPLARAYLPAQRIDGGELRIAVIEGHYGEIRIHNPAGLRGTATAPLTRLKSGDAVRAAQLEAALLSLQDLPGIRASATLTPGTLVGTTDLAVDIQRGPWLSGWIDLDNHGNRYTGEFRLGTQLQLDNPLRLGDRLSLRAMGSDEQQHYYRAAYQLPLGRHATRLGVAYSDLDYQLAKDFEALQASGNARIASAYLIQPLHRRRALSVQAQLQYDDKRLRDDIDLFAQYSRKQARVVTAQLSAQGRDALWGGGRNGLELAWSQGRLQFDDAAERAADAGTARTQGRFHKLVVSALRSQRLAARTDLLLQLQGQWADGNLDSSEKFSLGGASGVRAYPQGEASGDQGWLLNLELGRSLGEHWRLSAFADHGEVRLHQQPWGAGRNHRQLSGAGLGLGFTAAGWQLGSAVAWTLGGEDAQSDVTRTPRLWAQLVRYF